MDSTDTEPTVAEFIDTVVDPLTEFRHEEREPGRRFLRFLARLHSDRTGAIQKTEKEEYREMGLSMRRVMANADVMSRDWHGNDHAADPDVIGMSRRRPSAL